MADPTAEGEDLFALSAQSLERQAVINLPVVCSMLILEYNKDRKYSLAS
jgi:hypothetical protein